MNSKLREPLNVLYNIGRHEESGGLTDKELAFAEAEKAIRKAVAEEVLDIVNSPSATLVGSDGAWIKQSELRQKIKQWQEETTK